MPCPITIRGIPDEIYRRLQALARARGESLNETALEILRSALSIEERRRRLERYADWSEREHEEFEQALRDQRGIG